MKILLGVPEYPPHHIGGGGIVYQQLARRYHELGHQVVILAGDYVNHDWLGQIAQADADGIPQYRVPELPYPGKHPYLRTAMPPTLPAWRQIKRVIAQEAPDVAHLHGYGLSSVHLFARSSYQLGIPYLFTIHGYPETPFQKGAFVKGLWRIYQTRIIDPTLARAARITGVSNYIRRDERNIGAEKSTTIGNGIDPRDYQMAGDPTELRQQYGLDVGDWLILSLGRIAEMKGFQTMVKRIPQMREQGVKLKYVIAGADDGYQAQLEQMAARLGVQAEVALIGPVDEVTRNQYLAACDIVAIPSLWEPFGLVALEGMLFERVIISTETEGLSEVLAGYAKKVMIDSLNLVADVLAVIHQPGNFDQARFDWVKIAQEYLTQLETIRVNG